MADKDKLRDMLDSLIDDNNDQAQVHFHGYLEDKMRDMLRPEDVAAANEQGEEIVADDDDGETKE